MLHDKLNSVDKVLLAIVYKIICDDIIKLSNKLNRLILRNKNKSTY